MRVLRAIMVVFITFQAVETQSWWMLLLSAALLYQVVVNQTCSNGSCDLPKTKKE
jgi:hypothetical protein